MYQSSLILEGGANRGIFTSGVLDYLMEQGFQVPYVVGVSAGACNAMGYVSNQRGRTRACVLAQSAERKKLEELRRVTKTRSLFDMDLIFDRFPNKEIPFDYDTYFSSPMECEMVVTNCRTGEAEYFSERKNRKRLMDICRASSSVPVGAPMVHLNGQEYLDGGLADSVPIIHALQKGWKKNILVLTRNEGYRKKPLHTSRALYQAAYMKYPQLIRTICKRARVYNRTMAAVEKWEKQGRIFVIRPRMKAIGRLERDPQRLEDFYQDGYKQMRERYQELLEYLER